MPKLTYAKASCVFLITVFAMLTTMNDAIAQRNRSYQNRDHSAALCSASKPRVSVRLATSKTRYIRNKSARTINQLHSTYGSGTVLGLAGGPIEIAMQGTFEVRTQKAKSCVQIRNVDVLFSAKPEVIIASNFKKGSCEYREILAHEQKHIRTTRRFMSEYAPKLRAEVNKIIKKARTRMMVPQGQETRAQEQMQKEITNGLIAFQKKIIPILQERQTKIDTPEEYARVASGCKNWSKKLENEG